MMKIKGTRCCVPGCGKDSGVNRDVSFHKFPKEEYLKRVWVSLVHKEGKHSAWRPSKYSKICGQHFNLSGKKTYNDKFPRFFIHRTYPVQLFETTETFHNKIEINSDSQQGKVVGLEGLHIPENNAHKENIPAGDLSLSSTTYCCMSVAHEHNYNLDFTKHEECPLIIKKWKYEVEILQEKLAHYEHLTSENSKLKKQIINLESQLAESIKTKR